MGLHHTRLVLLGLAAVLASLVAGCGANCDVPAFAIVDVTLTPDTVQAGEQMTVVASFDRNVFGNAGFNVFDWGAVIENEAGTEFVGQYSDSVYRQDMGDPPFIDGVIIAGQVIDDRTFEMIVEFPSGMTPAALPVFVSSGNGGVECNTGVSGRATLAVTGTP